MFKTKNYLLVWKDQQSFNLYSFIQKILNNDYDEKELIRFNGSYISTIDQFVMINGEVYKMWSNMVVGKKNIIVVDKAFK